MNYHLDNNTIYIHCNLYISSSISWMTILFYNNYIHRRPIYITINPLSSVLVSCDTRVQIWLVLTKHDWINHHICITFGQCTLFGNENYWAFDSLVRSMFVPEISIEPHLFSLLAFDSIHQSALQYGRNHKMKIIADFKSGDLGIILASVFK